MKVILVPIIIIMLANTQGQFQQDDLKQSMARGKEIYKDYCTTCHLPSGLGTKSIFPPLANSDYFSNYRTEAIKSVKYGQKGKITVNDITYNSAMPNPNLSDEEVVDVLNYVMNSWGNTHKQVTINEVKSVKK